MSDISTFESRTGKLDCTTSDVYNFVTDIRNFERFIPRDKISNVKVNQNSFSFQASPLGLVNISITEKIMYSKVVYSGNTMQISDFSLVILINEAENNHSDVKIFLKAELNAFLKMLVSEPIKKFLETLICEMEKFKGWKDIN
jgi:carbon monoxide dehydrogenase subunit G